MQRRMLATAAGLAALLGIGMLSGCTAPAASRPAASPPSPSSTAIFASDAEALAAAEDAYAKYQAMEDTISHEGGRDPDRIRPFAARTSLEEAISGYRTFRELHQHSTGLVTIDHVELEKYDRRSVYGLNAVSIRACIDVSQVDLVNSDGASQVDPNRQARQLFRLTFDLSESSLLLSSRDRFDGSASCV